MPICKTCGQPIDEHLTSTQKHTGVSHEQGGADTPQGGHTSHSQPSHRGSNGASGVTMKVPLSVLPLLEHALAIERNVQMMSSQPHAQKLIEEIRVSLNEFIPTCARAFKSGNWAQIGTWAAAGELLDITAVHHGRYSWSDEWRVCVAPGSGKSGLVEAEEAEQLAMNPKGVVAKESLCKADALTLVQDILSEVHRMAPMQA